MARTTTLAVLALCLLGAAIARAGALQFHVTDQRGQPVRDAVVYVDPLPGTDVATIERTSQTRYIDQRNEQFIPYLTLLRPGDRVVFRNSDTTHHHVYSFAPELSFEFMLRPGAVSTPLTVTAPGIIAAGCNIHDRMITYLVVTTARWAGKTDSQGRWTLPEVPPGRFRVRVWHPLLIPGQPAPSREIEVSDAKGPRQVTFTLKLPPEPHPGNPLEPNGY